MQQVSGLRLAGGQIAQSSYSKAAASLMQTQSAGKEYRTKPLIDLGGKVSMSHLEQKTIE